MTCVSASGTMYGMCTSTATCVCFRAVVGTAMYAMCNVITFGRKFEISEDAQEVTHSMLHVSMHA